MIFDAFMNEVMTNVNVFGTCVHDGVMSQGNATLVVSMDDGCINSGVSEVLKEYPEPDGFFHRICCCHGGLFLCRPGDGATHDFKKKATDGSVGIRVLCSIGVCPFHKVDGVASTGSKG